MFAATRKEELCQELMRHKSISVKEMAEKLNVTEETIRRDIKILENEGIAEKTHGGAILKSTVLTVFSKTEHKKLLVDNKQAMAKVAAQYVSNGMCIFIDSSTSSYEILPIIADKNLIIVSNSLDVLAFCASRPNIKLICPGGEYDDKYGTFFGSQTIENLSTLNFDLAIMSCRTASLQSGICEGTRGHSDVKKIVANHSSKIITILDHTKINKTSFIKTMGVDETDILITDFPLPANWVDFLEQKKITCHIAVSEFPEYKYLLKQN